MTASTDKERASLSAFIEMAGREGFDTAHQWYDAKGLVFFGPSTADCWRYWQAARRAPAAPVPQGWVAIPLEPTVEEWRQAQGTLLDANWDAVTCLAARIQTLISITRDKWSAAAPQPPEAAPVELPEPVAVMTDTTPREPGWKTIFVPDAGTKLYTEQQVRQLLAQHGIKEQST